MLNQHPLTVHIRYTKIGGSNVERRIVVIEDSHIPVKVEICPECGESRASCQRSAFPECPDWEQLDEIAALKAELKDAYAVLNGFVAAWERSSGDYIPHSIVQEARALLAKRTK